MPCTTILVGKKASYDGSTMTARNEDSGAGHFSPKKFIVVHPEEQPRHYRSVISHVELDLPENPMRYTCMPNADPSAGIWGAAGVNEANVSMTATETLTTNERVQGADPLVRLVPAAEGRPEIPGGIGEEDMVTLVLPYIRSAREGVLRLGSLLETYGTYEMNGIAFQDVNEVWWLETIGGHHWIARRVPDDCYVVMPNQFGIDEFDLEDAAGEGREFLCSGDLPAFIAAHHLDLTPGSGFNARLAFGSHSDTDHAYNTPRAWIAQRYFNPSGSGEFRPDSDDIAWCRRPERLITVEDVKYVLSNHYQGTPYDPYSRKSDPLLKGTLRPIGVNRNNFLSLVQLRPDVPAPIQAIEWVAFASNVFNAFVPFYANVDETPAYFANTTGEVTTDSFYWANRLIGALADPHFQHCSTWIERYQRTVPSEGYALIRKYDAGAAGADAVALREQANAEIAAMVRKETSALLDHVLFEASLLMRNAFAKSDG